MSKIVPAKSSFIVTNISKSIIKVLGQMPLSPGQTKDLFEGIPNLLETTVMEALRADGGYLYRAVHINRTLVISSYNLMLLNSLYVDTGNLNAVNEPSAGKVLSVDADNNLKWVFGDMAARLKYKAPLQYDDEHISLPMADAFTNGFLSREDWIIFKGKSKGLRIWQYQDFEGPFSNPIRLDDFQNGEELSFNKNLIVDGTAVAVNVKDFNSAPRVSGGLRGLFSEKVGVNQHVRDTVFLDRVPDEKQRVRIYYLIILPDGTNVPVNYGPPTEYVRKKRIEYFDAIDIDSGGAKSIFGEKLFNDRIVVKDTVSIGSDLDDAVLSVDGDVSCNAVQIKDGSGNGYSLTSNAVGNGVWGPNPIVKSTPPVNSYNGRMWIKEPEYISFVYDGSRGKWVGIDSFSVDGQKNTTSGANVYMNGLDNVPYDINGIVLPYDAVLVGMTAGCEGSQSWIAEVHVKNRLIGNSILHVVNSDRASNMKLNIDFKAGDKVQLFASGTGLVMPGIRAIFKQRM